MPKLTSKDVALMAVFAALSAIVCKVIPGFPIYGLSGSNIKFDAALAPVYGMVIGPYLGFLAALIGGLIVANSWFSVLTSFCTGISALVAGLLVQRSLNSDNLRVKGWMLAALILAILIGGWYATWVGKRAIFYPLLHFIGLAIILTLRNRLSGLFWEGIEAKPNTEWQIKSGFVLGGIILFVLSLVFSKPYISEGYLLPYFSFPLGLVGVIVVVYGVIGGWIKEKLVVAVALAGYCGIIADHMLGNLIFITTIDILIPFSSIENWLKALGLPDVPSLFMFVLPVSTIERTILTVIATLFGVGLIYGLHRAGMLPTKGGFQG